MKPRRFKKNKNLISSFNNAINGIVYALKYERNMRVHLICAVIVLILALYFEISRIEFLMLCLVVAIVIICELLNTAVEIIVDAFIKSYNSEAKAIKDIAAGAVLVAAFFSIIIGYFIFYERLSGEIERGIDKLRHLPIHITLVAIIVTIAVTVIIKSISRKGTPFSGGMPSGHTAIAFSATTAVALWGDNINITLICLLLSLLLVQSRLESKIHTLTEIIVGAFLGIVITLLMFQIL